MIVLDASLVGPLVIPDEALDLPAGAVAALLAAPLHVPNHWRLEVANMLRSALRRGRMTLRQRDEGLRRLSMLAVTVDPKSWDAAWANVPGIADRYDLTPYDAAYIELAQRLGAPLATLDRALLRAAEQAGVATYEITP